MNLRGAAPDSIRRLALLAAGAVGFEAIVTQLVLMRELLAAFSGNELVFGISLGVWLLLTGMGAWLGRIAEPAIAANQRRAAVEIPVPTPAARPLAVAVGIGLVAIALLPLAEVAAVRGLRDLVFLRGAAVGVLGTTTGCLGFLAPFCLPSGALLTLACGLLAESAAPRPGPLTEPIPAAAGATEGPLPVHRPTRPVTSPATTASEAGARIGVGRIYIADAIGSVAGGIGFTFVLAPHCDHFAVLALAAIPNLAVAAAIAAVVRRPALGWAIGLATAALAFAVAGLDLDRVSTGWQHRGEIVRRASSPYGRLVVIRREGQLAFFENGLPVVYSDNTAAREEAVHYAMAQRPGARAVLLVSGAVSGAAREVLRYRVGSVTCVELDPRVAEIARELRPADFADPRLELVATDARRYLQHTHRRFDVVILDLPDPATLQLNRFFTAEFFGEVKRVLTPDGVFAFGLSHYENFVSRDLADLLSTAHHTLLSAFAHARMIPGGRVFFIASDADLTLDVAPRLEARGIATELVNRHYLDVILAPDRLADLQRAIARPAVVNRDFNPVLYHLHLRRWLGQFSTSGSMAETLLLLAFAAYFAWLPAVPRAIFASGFAASALEVVLLLALQAGYGLLYQQVGLVIAVFMAGLAAGAVGTDRRSKAAATVLVAQLGFATAATAVAMALLLPHLHRLDVAVGLPWSGQALILGFATALGICVGGQFPPAGAASPGGTMRVAARLFGADLAGASAGALLVSAWLIPTLGVSTVCLLTAALSTLAAALLWRRMIRDA